MAVPRDELTLLTPYLGEFHEACLLEGEDTALIGAVCLRETEAGWAPGYRPTGTHLGTGDFVARVGGALSKERVRIVRGDAADPLPAGWSPPRRKDRTAIPGPYAIPVDGKGFGRGLFQMDWLGPYGFLPRECPEAEPFLQARWACQVLRDARKELVEALGAAFAESPLFEVATICSYNAGSPAVVRMIRRGRHPDHATTDGPDPDPDGDYGSDVLARRYRLRQRFPERFPPRSP